MGLLLFQLGTQQQQNRPQDKASITGIILKMGSGDPVSKAVVTISAFNGGRSQSYTATTTAQGQFSFQNLDPGQYRLSATRSGFVRMEYGARTPNKPGLPITLNPGQRLTDVVLQIMPAGTISGRVFDRDGEPLANVTVEALKYSYQEGQKVMNEVQTTRTNDLGEYRLFWLQPGQYFVSATPPAGQRGALTNSSPIAGPGIGGAVGNVGGGNRGGGGGGNGGGNGGGPRGGGRSGQQPPPQAPPAAAAAQPASPNDEASEGYIPVYYPGTTDAQSAAPINLPAGIVFSGVDLTVAAVHTLRVFGQAVNGLTGQPVRNANLTLLPVQHAANGGGGRGARNPGNFRSRTLDDQGRFEISGVVPGSYELIGILNDRNNRMTARVPLEIGNSDVQNVSIIMTPGFTLAGHLSIEGQQAGTGNQDLPRVRVMLRSDSPQIGGANPASPVMADGTFTLQQVGRDDYRLTVSGMPRNGYIKSARFGAMDVLNDGLRLDRAPSIPLEIVVSPNTGIADGTVSNEKQDFSPNVTVVLIPDGLRSNRLDLYRTTSTDAMGHFHVEGVPPGDYKVFSWDDVETGAWQDPDFIRAYEGRGKSIRITEGGTTSNIDLRLIPGQS
jgi:protocatechuate 3,4-dioxygenase beta subunit